MARKGVMSIKGKKYYNFSKKDAEELDNFSIGEVMQLSPISVNSLEKVSSLENEVTFIKKMYKALYVSICYFAIATELRLICDEKYEDEDKKNSK